MSHHSHKLGRSDARPNHNTRRLVALTLIYLPTVLIALMLHDLAGLSVVPAILIAFLTWAAIATGTLLILRHSHHDRRRR
jgi:cell division protein FtsW (lipid II flippase)